jgi:integration host factor subunit beta
MTKNDLILELGKRFPEFTQKEMQVMVNTVLSCLTDAMMQGERIEIRGFGSFTIKRRRARRSSNPKTGRPVSVPAKRIPFFKVGKELKLIVNHSRGDSGRKGKHT